MLHPSPTTPDAPPQTLTIRDPARGVVIDELTIDHPAAVAAAVHRARQAQTVWSALGARERVADREVLRSLREARIEGEPVVEEVEQEPRDREDARGDPRNGERERDPAVPFVHDSSSVQASPGRTVSIRRGGRFGHCQFTA